MSAMTHLHLILTEAGEVWIRQRPNNCVELTVDDDGDAVIVDLRPHEVALLAATLQEMAGLLSE